MTDSTSATNDAAHDGQHDLLTGDHGNGPQRPAQRQRAHVAHEDLGRVRVEPQEGQPAPGHGGAEDHQLARARDVGKSRYLGRPTESVT